MKWFMSLVRTGKNWFISLLLRSTETNKVVFEAEVKKGVTVTADIRIGQDSDSRGDHVDATCTDIGVSGRTGNGDNVAINTTT